MERKDLKKLLLINDVAFPQFYTKMTDEQLTLRIDVWFDLFKDYDGGQIEAAFRQALATAQYPVKPADVFAIINAQHKANLPTMDELYEMAENAAENISQYYSLNRGWETEWGAIKTGYQSALEIYNQLPAILREWKRSPLDLLNWWYKITDDNESYIRREFNQVIIARLERRKMLGIDFGAEFNPLFENTTGCMKAIPELSKKQIGSNK